MLKVLLYLPPKAAAARHAATSRANPNRPRFMIFPFECTPGPNAAALDSIVNDKITMATVLITAFEPYDRWPENSSWLALVELARDLPVEPRVVTRRYPVDFEAARSRLVDDLAANYDFVLHLGQAPGISRVHLEAIGVNI